MMTRLADWWQTRSGRERVMLSVMGVLLAATLLWLGVWRPVTSGLENARADHEAAQVRHMSIAGKVALLREAGRRLNVSTRPVEQIVGASAAEAGFTLAQVQRRGDAGMAFSIPSAKSAALLTWLAALEQQGLAISALTISPSGAAGTVQAQIAVSRTRS